MRLNEQIITEIQARLLISLTKQQFVEILDSDPELKASLKKYRSFDTAERDHFFDAMAQIALGPEASWPRNADGDCTNWYIQFAEGALGQGWTLGKQWKKVLSHSWIPVRIAARALRTSEGSLLRALLNGELKGATYLGKQVVNINACREWFARKTWKTEDGRLIRIYDMADDHLLRAVNMLFRNQKKLYLRWLSSIPPEPPAWFEGVERAGHFDVDDARVLCPDATAFLERYTRYPMLLAEAKRRGLSV